MIKRNFHKKQIIGYVFSAIALLLMSGTAFAHKITVFAYTEGDTVKVESKFSGGRKVRQGDVLVSDTEGNPLLRGKIADEGEFSFKIPKKTALKITVSAGMGHQGEWTVPVEELGMAEETAGTSSQIAETKAPDEPVSPRISSAVSRGDSEEIQAAVEKALDKKLKPVIKLLNESRRERGPSLTDILGGIGYIFGLAGIAAIFSSRRKSSGSSES